jgi:hypothetical protein
MTFVNSATTAAAVELHHLLGLYLRCSPACQEKSGATSRHAPSHGR